MEQWLAVFFYANFLIAFISYIYLYKRRKLIGFHLGMNIAMVAGGGLSLGTGVILINQFPLHYLEITVASALTGILAGVLFGALFDYQTLLTGHINGLLMGIMAPMVGAASSGSLIFMIFLEVFVVGSFAMVLVSSKLS
ncbi:hypothetical protein [Peribacillus glennii]|uniref:Uncharacterized protein n=1 Tax=Peribacillus glennii TaxID=2303991 RepID=A0A372L8K3_9BACI|nr:hypothetical protein [Peribacillus glennii]RFU61747.1 hypothetical protein D0466_16525 [Peribacillus glennii]